MKKLLKYLPILSVILIFVGYCHLHFFYCWQFDIEIYSFITTGEIILSFLPIAFYLFLLGIVLGFLLLIAYSHDKFKGRSVNKIHSVSVNWNYLKRKRKALSLRRKFSLLLSIIFHVQMFLFYVLLFFSRFIYANDLYKDYSIATLLIGTWVLLVLYWRKRTFHVLGSKVVKKYNRTTFGGCFILLGFLFGDYVFIVNKANDIKLGRYKSAIKFECTGKEVNTFSDSLLSFIGSTQQYVFIFNTLTKNNFVYEKSQIANLVLGEKILKHFTFSASDTANKQITSFVLSLCDSLRNKKNTEIDSAKIHQLTIICDSLYRNNIFNIYTPSQFDSLLKK